MSHRQRERTTACTAFLFLLFRSRHPSSGAAFSFSPLAFLEKLRVRVTRLRHVTRRWPDTRKRHSRPLVTTALKRRSIFRCVCLCHRCFTPWRLSPRGGPCLSRRSPPLPRAISWCARRVVGLPLLFFVDAFRPSTARLVPVSSSLVSRLQSLHSLSRNKIVGLQ